jgi:hypothetical protein
MVFKIAVRMALLQAFAANESFAIAQAIRRGGGRRAASFRDERVGGFGWVCCFFGIAVAGAHAENAEHGFGGGDLHGADGAGEFYF